LGLNPPFQAGVELPPGRPNALCDPHIDVDVGFSTEGRKGSNGGRRECHCRHRRYPNLFSGGACQLAF